MFTSLSSLLDLIYPAHCLNCHSLGGHLCANCSIEWQSAPFIFAQQPIRMWAAAHYSAKTSQIILAAKEDNNRAARKILASAISKSLVAAMKIHPQHIPLLIPIPSSKGMNRRRGFAHSLLLSEEVARIYPGEINIAPILFHNRAVRDQSQLSFSARAGNLFGAYSVDSASGERPRGEVAIVIDDLVTSGSSVKEAVRALKSGAISPVAAISACAVGSAYRLR